MGFKAILQRKVAGHLFSVKRRNAQRQKAERKRRSDGTPHLVEYFHEAGDPYSHLMMQLLPAFCGRYDIELKIHIVPPPPDWAAPDRARLDTYARKDAARLAKIMGLAYEDPGHQPADADIELANAALLGAVADNTFLESAAGIGDKLWKGQAEDAWANAAVDVSQTLAASNARRDALGHYLGAVLFYAGEWYWGPDRLHYLENRLRGLGVARQGTPDAPLFAPPSVPSARAEARPEQPLELHWYLSFRSPYTGIVADRVKALAEAYGAELKLRYVLPMVMRGMQVPRMKGFYIMKDAVREAERLGIPFGDMCDPVGEPVERGYAILHKAIALGQGFQFARSFLSGVWAEGLDAGSDRGLKIITERAGLSWAEMKRLIGGDHWRADAQANQDEMFSYGVWGVPSFRVGDVAVWGQDRLWVVEEALAAGAK